MSSTSGTTSNGRGENTPNEGNTLLSLGDAIRREIADPDMRTLHRAGLAVAVTAIVFYTQSPSIATALLLGALAGGAQFTVEATYHQGTKRRTLYSRRLAARTATTAAAVAIASAGLGFGIAYPQKSAEKAWAEEAAAMETEIAALATALETHRESTVELFPHEQDIRVLLSYPTPSGEGTLRQSFRVDDDGLRKALITSNRQISQHVTTGRIQATIIR